MNHPRVLLSLCSLFAVSGAASAQEAPAKPKVATSPYIVPAVEPTERPVEAVKHVVVISVDGLRPDLLLRAETPNIKGLMKRGSFTMWARTTPNSITLPSHVSMLSGVNPRRHDVEWNREFDTTSPVWPRVPTLFEAAKRHGYTTAVAAGKSKFDMFARPGVLDWEYIPQRTTATKEIARRGAEMIREHKPGVTLVHFAGVDSAGHGKGWSSPEQMAAIEEADAGVGQVLAAIDEAGMRDSTLVILSADHGGAGRNHGPEDPRSRHIPWIAAGPGIRQNLDLTIYQKLDVDTEDTFATACWMLGIRPTVSDLDGVPVKLILEQKEGKELLSPGKTELSW